MIKFLRNAWVVIMGLGAVIAALLGLIVAAVVGVLATLAMIGAPFILAGLIAIKDWLEYCRKDKK